MGYLTPAVSGTFAGEMIWPLTAYTILNVQNDVQRVEVVYGQKFITKRTGFEAVRHTVHAAAGADTLVELYVELRSQLHWSRMERYVRLANAVNGAGMQLQFNDDWVTNKLYSARWVNAGEFADQTEVYGAVSLRLSAWSVGNAA